ncbi:alpha-L-fucosidase [Brachybacterium halotolerans subsp. kimchii]|uniref:alpha-L-fucosidase n=1 Tax=Brachybacterium halotolerans TaxID=2795215 RepID=UPI001E46265B|nr:alpha-L-fucosidase [Brachybacterium halotolerans]UEJ83474.1 alpha-L-fucosidase [Brachybacterium halotolerans subsp. kimchii]
MSDDVHPEAPQQPVPPLQPSDPLRPTPEQLAWQREGLGVFFHVGVNTFAGLEWSDGTLSPRIFDPTDLDVDEWVRIAHDLGAAYVVLTAKHHDGFCLWPTATTDYSVRASLWRQGRGDLVAEVAAACERWGLGLGLYLSPWDRHAPEYADPARYDALYLAQLRELCAGYGPLHELWFDGAGSAGREYDWEAIGDLVDELQPGAMVFTMGRATIRWVGNEDGQRIRRHRILDAECRELAAGGTVGVRRIHRLAAPVTAEVLQLEIEGEGAALDAACVHDARGIVVPDLSGARPALTTAPDGPLPA